MRTRCALAAACMLLAVAAPARAQPQRGAVRQLVERQTGQLAVALEGPAPAPRRPAALTPCGSWWNADIRRVAEGPEMAWSYGGWIDSGFKVIQKYGGLPLPLCFTPHRDTLTTRQGRALLTINNEFITERTQGVRRFPYRFSLTGYPDPAERDPSLALRRAEWIQAQTTLPPCRLVPSADLRPQTQVFHRKVYYTLLPASRTCPQPP